MKLVVGSLVRSLPAVSNVFGVVLIFIVVFSILGMQLFSGALASCTDPQYTTRATCEAAAASAAAAPPMLASPHSVATGVAAEGRFRRLKGGGDGDDEYVEGDPIIWRNPVFGSFDNFGSSVMLVRRFASRDRRFCFSH